MLLAVVVIGEHLGLQRGELVEQVIDLFQDRGRCVHQPIVTRGYGIEVVHRLALLAREDAFGVGVAGSTLGLTGRVPRD